MSNQPFFTIVIPVYNREDILHKTIESITAQTCPDYEVIIVDDGSTDKSYEVAKRYASEKIKIFTKENGERGAARNFGANKAAGRYVNFFDSDDLMRADHLSNVHDYLRNHNYPPVVYTGHKHVDEQGNIIRVAMPNPRNFIKALAYDNFLGCNSVILDLDVFRKFYFNEKRELAISEDKELWLRVASKYPFSFIPVDSFFVVEHSNRSLNTQSAERLEARATSLVELLKEDVPFRKVFAGYFHFIAAFEWALVSLAYSENHNARKAGQYLRKAVAEHFPIIFTRRWMAALKNYFLVKFARSKYEKNP
jgi:glycosyltransferase involved in cell wall biosynthesis